MNIKKIEKIEKDIEQAMKTTIKYCSKNECQDCILNNQNYDDCLTVKLIKINKQIKEIKKELPF